MVPPRKGKTAASTGRSSVGKDAIGFGIIGCGVIAPFHAESVLAASGARLAACCDIVPEKARAFAEKFGIPHCYRDLDQMLRQDDVQAVCICTPSGLHARNGIAAAEAGKHIMWRSRWTSRWTPLKP